MKQFKIYLLTCVASLIFSELAIAQENFLTEVDAQWNYKPNVETPWVYKFGAVYRNTYYSDNSFDFATDFLQLSVAPGYVFNKKHAVQLEFRYRIKELFDKEHTDEKRIVEQYTHRHVINKVTLSGRLRLEQRFRKNFNWRNRYKISATLPIIDNPNPNRRLLFTAETETLWSINPSKNPSFDQRFSVVLAKPLSKTFVLKLKPEYRHLDFTNTPHNLWNIYTILGIVL